MTYRRAREAFRLRAGTLDPEQLRIGRLVERFVPSCRLAQLVARADHVEDVVRDLEREANLGAELLEGVHARPGGLGREAAQDAGRLDECAGLAAMHPDQFRKVESPAFRFEVEPLSAHHALDAARLEKCRGHCTEQRFPQAKLRRRLGQDLRGHWNEEKTHPGCGVHIELAMHGRPSPPQVIIIHARKVVMHQRVGVHDFHRRRHPGNGGDWPAAARYAAMTSAGRTRLPGLRSA